KKIILHVGSCIPRKNVELILRALNELRDLDALFVQVGGTLSPSQVEMIKSFELRNHVIQLPPLFGHALSLWYHTADVFVFPSLYEGFGMPLAEAMACGVPCVAANASSLPEVAGDAALFVDPNDVRALAQSVRTVLSESRLRDDLRARGLNR